MTTRITKAGNIKYALSGDDKFIASVEPGEEFVVETAINVIAAPHTHPAASRARHTRREWSHTGARPSARKGSAGVNCRGP